MSIARYLSKLAGFLNSSGVVGPTGGGTGITSPGTAGNVLTSDGAGNWTSAAPSGGGSFTKLDDKTVSVSGTGTISFTGIVNTYSHLKVIGYVRGNSGTDWWQEGRVQFNGDTGNSYTYDAYGFGNNAAYGSDSSDIQQPAIVFDSWAGGQAVTNNFSFFEMLIPFYATTTGFKTGGYRWNAVGASTARDKRREMIGDWGWQSTTAINRIDVIAPTSGFFAGSRVSLYGIS